MFRLVSIVFIFSSYLFANTLIIDSIGNTTLNTKQNQIIIEDKEHIFTSYDILKNHFQSNYHKSNVSYTKSIFWTKTHIKNTSNKPMLLLFRNNRAGIDYIDINVYDTNDNLIKYQQLGDLRTHTDRIIIGTKSVFHQRIEPNQELIVISSFSSLGAMDLYWDILDVNYYSHISTLEYIFWGLFGGVILIIAIYNIFLLIALKQKVFIFYILHCLSVLVMVYSLNGVLYILDLGIDLYLLTLVSWFVPPLMLLFLNLFSFSFFNITKQDIMQYRLFSIFISIYFIWFFVFLYSLVDTSTLQSAKYFVYIMLLNMFFLISVAIKYIKRGTSGAIFFLIGESVYLASLIYSALLVLGLLPSNYPSIFVMPVALLIEIICFTLALSYQIYELKKLNEKQKLVLLHSKNTSDIALTFKNLSHQFRQPLSYISSQFMYLETMYNVGQKEKIAQEFLDIKDRLNYSVECMSQTLTLFSNFYNESNEIVAIYPKKDLENLVKMYDQRLILNNIKVNINCENLTVYSYKGYFTNVINILLENSIESFEEQKVQNGTIDITLLKDGKVTTIQFVDNGKGIDIKPIEKIFDANFTTKKGKYGLGLSIAKVMIEEKLKSNIKVKSEYNKTIFEIRLHDLR